MRRGARVGEDVLARCGVAWGAIRWPRRDVLGFDGEVQGFEVIDEEGADRCFVAGHGVYLDEGLMEGEESFILRG